MSVFERLNYNFDSDKFGDAQYLSEQSLNMLKLSTKNDLYEWQKKRLESNTTVEVSEYRQNPFGNICNNIFEKVNSIVSVTEQPPADWTTWVSGTSNPIYLLAAAQELVIEIGEFQNHTANLCGVSKFDFPDPNVPTYDFATTYGRQSLNILYQTDKVQNTIPILGSFTSLFIKNELENVNTYFSNTEVSGFIANPAAADTIIVTGITANLNSTITLIRERRLHDWQFFSNTKNLINDYVQLKKLGMASKSGTETLLNDVIGKDDYKQNLASQIVEDDRKEYEREYVGDNTCHIGGIEPPPEENDNPDTETCTIPEQPPQYIFNFIESETTTPPPDTPPSGPNCSDSSINKLFVHPGASGEAVLRTLVTATEGDIISIRIPKLSSWSPVYKQGRNITRLVVQLTAPVPGTISNFKGVNLSLTECKGNFSVPPTGSGSSSGECIVQSDRPNAMAIFLTYVSGGRGCKCDPTKDYYCNIKLNGVSNINNEKTITFYIDYTINSSPTGAGGGGGGGDLTQS